MIHLSYLYHSLPMIEDFQSKIFLCCGINLHLLCCSFVNASQESCLGTVENISILGILDIMKNVDYVDKSRFTMLFYLI